MLKSSNYRSVNVRSVNPSPSRRAVMEIFMDRNGGERSSPSSSRRAAPPRQQPAEEPATDGAEPTPTPRGRQSVIYKGTATRAGTPQPRRSESPANRPSSRASTPRGRAGEPPALINLENFEKQAIIRGVFNSPRSLAVCAENGIHPEELVPRAPEQFYGTGVPENIAQRRFEHYEERRSEKLEMLRAGRQTLIYKEHKQQNETNGSAAAPGSAVATPRGGNTSGAVVPYSQGSSSQLFARGNSSYQSRSAVAPNETLQQRATVAMEKNAKRQLAYERAKKLREEKEEAALRRQVESERRSIAHQQLVEAERQVVMEERRLRWEDSREHVQHLRRQQNYQADRRADRHRVIDSAPRDIFRLEAAKEAYFTPRQRAATKRSVSAH